MESQEGDRFCIAIIGGGLCGLALACALRKRHVSFKIYEARASFQELGAGINIGPNALRAFELIDPSLGVQVRTICSQNPPGKQDVWFQLRLGAPTREFEDGHLVHEIMAPPTGNMTAHRNELLQALADSGSLSERTEFGKKLMGLEEQQHEKVTLRFTDGTVAYANAVVACDGIHSVVRQAILDEGDPAAVPQYADSGAYRGLPSTTALEKVVGKSIAYTSQIFVGPDGYIIMYPISGGRHVNIGFWHWRRSEGVWCGGRDWVLPDQGREMKQHFEEWGETAQKLMDEVGEAPFYATHYHTCQPTSWVKGRVCLIGDAAHSMPPHQGAGAGQAMEDSFVLAETLTKLLDMQNKIPDGREVEAAFKSWESVRRPRAQRVLESSHEALSFWSDLYKLDLTQNELDRWAMEADARFGWIWNAELEVQAARSVNGLENILANQT